MSRFPEYEGDDEYAHLAWARYENNLRRAIAGKKGQRVLRDLRAALLALPERRLIEGDLATPAGEVCLIGALVAYKKAEANGVPVDVAARALADVDPEPWDGYERDAETGRYTKTVVLPWDSRTYKVSHGGEGTEHTIDAAVSVGVVKTLAWEMGSNNDDLWGRLTPEKRWEHALAWVEKRIVEPS